MLVRVFCVPSNIALFLPDQIRSAIVVVYEFFIMNLL